MCTFLYDVYIKKHFSDENGTNGLVVTDWKKIKRRQFYSFWGLYLVKKRELMMLMLFANGSLLQMYKKETFHPPERKRNIF